MLAAETMELLDVDGPDGTAGEPVAQLKAEEPKEAILDDSGCARNVCPSGFAAQEVERS